MFDISDSYKQLDELQAKLEWLISGYGQHGLKISDAHKFTFDWIKENYNFETFSCKHKKVSEIGYVIVAGENGEVFEKLWDGYCESCKRTVWGRTKRNNEIIKTWY